MPLYNPYTIAQEESRRISCNISVADYHVLFDAIPWHGNQDRFLSLLFKKFISLYSNEIPQAYDLDSEEKIVLLIGRLTTTRADEG